MKTKERYFNFPIQLLSGFLKNPDLALEKIVDYALYVHIQKNIPGNENFYVKMQIACEYYQISITDNAKSYRNGELLFNQYGDNSPITGLNKTIFLSFYKRHKSEFDYVCLVAFLAIKSILSTKQYCKTTNQYLWSRMDGRRKTVSQLTLSSEIRKYATDYQTRKIKNELKLNWHLKTYSLRIRGFYVSFDFTLETLIYVAEGKRLQYRLKKYQEEERAAIATALEKLKSMDQKSI